MDGSIGANMLGTVIGFMTSLKTTEIVCYVGFFGLCFFFVY